MSHLLPDPRRSERVAPFAAMAFLGMVVVGQPVGPRGTLEFVLGGALTAVIAAALLFAPRPSSRTVSLVLPALAYLVAVALLRDATGGSRGGMNALVLLPAVAVALYGTRRQLWSVIAGLVLVFVLPLVFIGGDSYPILSLRSATLFAAIATIVGLSIQELVAELREREAERERLLVRLSELASTDALTGLANRRAWNETLDRSLAQARRTEDPIAAAVLDLDHFKAINDTYGHAAGDRLLRELAAVWQGEIRPADALGRIGGDEFALLLPGCETDAALAIVERLCRLVPGDHTCSAGVAIWDGVESAEQLVARADAALYGAKAAGRARVHGPHTRPIAATRAQAPRVERRSEAA